ncbi:MAG: 50S ribosomal protein L25 [Thermomicrobiales bacterium]|jgi:large subunit ribosomal protein L25|nr:50S ribosomal protein L25 [Thermomicrobiales bacterium]
MATPELNAQLRTITGKKVKKLRRVGLLPAVVYGPAMKGIEILELGEREFERIYAHAGSSTLLNLTIEGGATRPVLIHQVQHDATRRRMIHVDFFAIDMQAELTVAVPLALVGEAPGVTVHRGIATQLLSELQIRCLPNRIPAALEVDLSRLTEIGAQLTAGDITLPQGVALVTPADELIVKIDAPAIEEEPVAAAEEAEETPAAEAEPAEETSEPETE